MSRYLSINEAWNTGDRRADDATKPLGESVDPLRRDSGNDFREFPMRRSGIPAEVFLFDRGTDKLVRPRRRAV